METRSSINVEYRSAPLTPEAMAATRITITPFRHQLPVDIVGGSSKRDAAARTLTLHYGPLMTEADLPTDRRTGKPRTFLRDRGEFTRRIMEDAHVGDVVIFEHISTYEYRLHLEHPTASGFQATLALLNRMSRSGNGHFVRPALISRNSDGRLRSVMA